MWIFIKNIKYIHSKSYNYYFERSENRIFTLL